MTDVWLRREKKITLENNEKSLHYHWDKLMCTKGIDNCKQCKAISYFDVEINKVTVATMEKPSRRVVDYISFSDRVFHIQYIKNLSPFQLENLEPRHITKVIILFDDEYYAFTSLPNEYLGRLLKVRLIGKMIQQKDIIFNKDGTQITCPLLREKAFTDYFFKDEGKSHVFCFHSKYYDCDKAEYYPSTIELPK